MSRWRCKSCKGEFADPQPDGARYFHVCPPLVDPKTGESEPRPNARDERPQDVSIFGKPGGYTVFHVDGKTLSTSRELPAAPIRAEGAGREKVK